MRFLIGWLALVAAMMLDSSPAGAQQKKLRPLRIALPSHSVSSTPIYVAQESGNFREPGI